MLTLPKRTVKPIALKQRVKLMHEKVSESTILSDAE